MALVGFSTRITMFESNTMRSPLFFQGPNGNDALAPGKNVIIDLSKRLYGSQILPGDNDLRDMG